MSLKNYPIAFQLSGSSALYILNALMVLSMIYLVHIANFLILLHYNCIFSYNIG